MKNGTVIRLEVRSIANGYLVSTEKREGYREASTDLTYYATLGEIDAELSDLLDTAMQLEVPEADAEEMPF